MILEIGIVSGEIIDLLEKSKRALTLSEVEIFINRPIDIVYMALGWLIREHFVRVVEINDGKYLFMTNKHLPSTNTPQVLREHLN